MPQGKRSIGEGSKGGTVMQIDTQVQALQKRYIELQKRANIHAIVLEQAGAKIAAISNYMHRYMEPKRYEYASKWLHEIAQVIYDDNVCLYTEVEMFEQLYGIDPTDLSLEGIDYSDSYLVDVMKEYQRAVYTFGEILLAIEPEAVRADKEKVRKSLKEEIKYNLEQIEKLSDNGKHN